ncbi:MAG: PAS domain S-box protein [Dehalobacterium sp.]
MKGQFKTKRQLIKELNELRQQMTDLDEGRKDPLQASFFRIFDHSFNEIYIFDQKTLKFIYANQQSLQNLGYTMEELYNMTPLDIKPNLSAAQFESLVKSLCTGNKNYIAFKSEHRRKNGSLYPIDVKLELSHIESPPVFVAVIQDITYHKQLEKKLRQGQEELDNLVRERTVKLIANNRQLQREIEKQLLEQLNFLQLLIDTIPNPVFYKNKEGLFQGCNTAYERYIGLTREEIIGKSVYEVYPKDLAAVYSEKDTDLINSSGIQVYEALFQIANGTRREIVFNMATYHGIDGYVAGIVGVIVDITERKQAEEQLRSEREKLFSLLNRLPALICLYDKNYYIRFANSCFNESFGKPGERPCYEILWGLRQPCDICPVRYVLETKQLCKLERTYPNGRSYQVYNYQYIDIDGTPLVLALGIDITDSKRIEEALWDSQLRYSALLKALPVGVVQIDPSGTCVYNNEEIKRITGCSSRELINFNWLRTVHPEDKEQVMDKWMCALKKQDVFHMEFRYLRSDGKVSWVMGQAVPFKGHNYKLLGYIATLSDITERKLSEESLRFSEERFYKAFNANPAAMSISSAISGRIMEVNKSFEYISGYRRDEVIGQTLSELNFYADPEDRIRMRELTKQGPIHNIEIKMVNKSGQILVGLLSAEPVELNGEPCILGMFNDTTERKQLEKEMARLERLSLVGEMAAGIGHEIRNPLTTVRGFLQLLGEKHEFDRHKQYYELMIEELDRANGIISEFLFLAKDKVVKLKVQSLNGIIKAMQPLIEADAVITNKNIKLKLQDLVDLPLNEGEIRQLILNLVRNGLEAMEPGGTLTISTFQEGNKVTLTIEDQGTGINPDILERMGTPFCTTKDSGTGLGLAVCYSISVRHNAAIKFETGPAGTTFFVFFNI